MEKLIAIIFLAVIVEGLVEYIKQGIEKKICPEIIGTMVAGIVLAFVFDLDLFEVVGIPARVPVAGNILTGILISRGSNYVFDLVGKLTEIKERLTPEQEENMAIVRDDEPNEDVVDHEEAEG